ncbi:MAG: hypothetical protein WCT18_01360 [Patescibacteria group bacterium]
MQKAKKTTQQTTKKKFHSDQFYKKLRKKHQKILLVTHESPDCDAIASIFSFLKAINRSIWDVGDSYTKIAFVKAGTRYNLETPNDVIVIHFDVGGRCDRLTEFDHHEVPDPAFSATQVVFEAFPNLNLDGTMESLRLRINEVDSKRARQRQKRESLTEQNEIKKQLITFNQQQRVGRLFVVKKRPLQDFVELISNMEFDYEEISSEEKMRVGLIALDTWYEKTKIDRTETVPTIESTEGQIFMKTLYVFISLLSEGKNQYSCYDNEILNLYHEAKFFESKCCPDDKTSLQKMLWENKTNSADGKFYHQLQKFLDLFYEPKNMSLSDTTEFVREIKDRLTCAELDIVTVFHGPWTVLRLFPDLRKIPEIKLIRYLLALLRGFYNKTVGNDRVRKLFTENEQLSINGINTLIIKETTIKPAVLRHRLGRNKDDFQVDLVISKHVKNVSQRNCFALTKIVGRNDRFQADGFDEIQNFLRSAHPEIDAAVFLHNEKFVIYLESEAVDIEQFVNIDDLANCVKHFSSLSLPVPQNEEPEDEEETISASCG